MGAQEPDELFETLTQCLMSGADRDALSGWGAIVYVMCAPCRPILVFLLAWFSPSSLGFSGMPICAVRVAGRASSFACMPVALSFLSGSGYSRLPAFAEGITVCRMWVAGVFRGCSATAVLQI